MKVKVILEQGESGWIVAHVPALPGCVSQGRTREEAIENIKEAIEGWLEVANDKNDSHGGGTRIEEVAVAV